MAGDETEEYVDDPRNWSWYDVNTIANYDPDIIPFLQVPFPVALARAENGRFVEEAFEPGEPPDVMPVKKGPPPGFPIVQGDHVLTADWAIHLPEPFARRVEDGSLVLWRPGLTIWLTAWNNDNNETQAKRLASITDAASPARFAERESMGGGVTRFSYRLWDENEDGPVESLNAYVIGDDGHLQLSVYFDDAADESKARQIVDSVSVRRPAQS